MPERHARRPGEQHGTGPRRPHRPRRAPVRRPAPCSWPYGDTPLLQGESLRAFAEEHRAAELRGQHPQRVVADPYGYGRIVRNDEGDVEAIVEEKDATAEQREIREINSGILAFDAEFLVDALPRLGNDNAKGEYYLTDIVGLAREAGLAVGAFPLDDVMQTEGANDRVQLAALGRELNRRIVERWMRDGVTVIDPATTWIDADVAARPRRDDPARHPAARRHRRRGGRRDRPRHARSRTARSAAAPASSAPTASSR